MLLLITGCNNAPDISGSDSKGEWVPVENKEISISNDEEENDNDFLQEVRETVNDGQCLEISEEDMTDDVESKENVKQVVTTPLKDETRVTEEPKGTVLPKEESKQEEVKKTEPKVEQDEKQEQPKDIPTQEPQESLTEETSKEEIVVKETEVTFDGVSWISFAKSYAANRGLTLDKTATECWDNPITANARCKYLERDIKDRIDYYVDVEGFSSVWIWYEVNGDNSYLIYIGYA